MAKSDSAPAHGAPVSARSKWSFGVGCIGRDANYTLVSNFILTYLTLGVGVTNWQLGAVGVVMVVARVWDAVNDPMMGTIIDNTNTRWGKYKPFILSGALLNAVFVVLLFSDNVQGERLFVLIFAITYILWGMTYTMNDISYWSMLPSLTVDPKEREKVTSIARIGANVGLFLTTAAVPAVTGGRMATMFPVVAKVVAVLFVACQILIVVGVQEPKNRITQSGGHTRLRGMVKVIFKNDQLLIIAGAILLFNIGYFTTTSFGVQFFYFDYGVYGGMEFTYFAITIGVAQIATLALYPQFSKRWNRKQLFTAGTIAVVVGYALLMAVGYVLPMNMVMMCIIGLVLFAGQAVIQLLNYVLLADTIEYGQWKLGTRNASITYSLNPFITKLASAIQAGIFSVTMIVSGLNPYSEQLSRLDRDTSLSREQVLAEGQKVVEAIPGGATLVMRLSMVVLPLVLIVACYFIYRAKFKIDEPFYARIISDLEERAAHDSEEGAAGGGEGHVTDGEEGPEA